MDNANFFYMKFSTVIVTKSKNKVVFNSDQTTLMDGFISNEMRKIRNVV